MMDGYTKLVHCRNTMECIATTENVSDCDHKIGQMKGVTEDWGI